MDPRRHNRFFALTLAASLVLCALGGPFQSSALAAEATDKPAEAGAAPVETPAEATADEEQPVEQIQVAEPTRISGKIYKVDPEEKMIGVLVQLQPSRAYRRYRLIMDDKSLILIGGQPSSLDALSNGQDVQVGFFRKGKQDVIDTVVVGGE